MRVSRVVLMLLAFLGASASVFGWATGGKNVASAAPTASDRGSAYGIREDVPKQFRDKFQKWKTEVLATDFGREQWAKYADRKDFLLTIVVSPERKFGAGTDDFEWDDQGNLVAATITLGKDLERGFPGPVYYPVMNSLASYDGLYEIDGNILAGAKLIHEIGHVDQTLVANAGLFQQQNKLMASYNRIFLKNGYDTKDPRLVALEKELGASPVAIWEDREYWSEVNAMRFLIERMGRTQQNCNVFNRIRRNVATYATNYSERFEALEQAVSCS